MIQLQRVTKLYGPVIGVNDVSLDLVPGPYGLLGPNGSGKSTLLNLITGQLRPTLGSITVLGERPTDNTDMLRRVGVCPERDLYLPTVSGLKWVSYLLELYGFASRDAAHRAEKALVQVGMAGAMRRTIGTYSRGMRQRTKLAQAIAHDPELLILDEPFGGLDPIGRHDMIELLKRLAAEGKSILLASHILHDVEAITDSFLLICSGRLLASGSAEEVHALLADVPADIRIRCEGAATLAHRLLDQDGVEAVRFDPGDVLVVSTRSPATIYERLPQWIAGSDIRVREIHSGDASLQSLFNLLLKIHRGERQ